MLKATLLGTGGMMPLPARALASAMLEANGRRLLIDCGEGTQVRIRACGLGFKAIDGILITHFHGDHVVGLPGLLLSMANSGREAPLLIAGPTGLRRVVECLRVVAPGLPFDILYCEIDPDTPEGFACAGFNIAPFPLRHGMPCLGYRVTLPRAGKFLREQAEKNGVPMRLWSVLQKQSEAEWEGVRYTREMVLTPPRRGITVVYATDTRPTDALLRAAHDADLLIAEAMYGDPDKLPRALEAHHMMMTEAATIARDAEARRLWLTHYSPAMPDPALWIDSARDIYPDAVLGEDGMSEELGFVEELEGKLEFVELRSKGLGNRD